MTDKDHHLSPVQDPAPAAPGPDPAATPTDEAMHSVQAAVLSLLDSLDRPPTSVKVAAAGVELELSWATAPPAPLMTAPMAGPIAVHALPAAVPLGADAAPAPVAAAPALSVVPSAPAASPSSPSSPASSGPAEVGPDPALDHIHAPTVGVFYRRPDPSSPNFVEEGELVTSGQQVGIVEAMKLMIPVVSDRAGRIGIALKGDADSVEYGEPLFSLVPSDEA